MLSSTILAALASVVSLTSARIVGISVPETIKPGDGFNLYIQTENYIQSVYDVAIAVGVAPGAGNPQSLGTVMDSFYLGPGTFSLFFALSKEHDG
jgi:Nis1 family